MGLASALSTSLTGLSAAEAVIDVVGNNLANAQTIGYKESNVTFATQFLQTLSLGSGSTDSRGGTNPRQIGLGTQVAEISPNFRQGTVQISTNPADLAIQGDGFLIVQSAAQGEQLYTRNGQFKTNASNELITSTGQRLLGFGVDQDFVIQRTTLQPINIPLGSAAVAQATQNVFFEGTLSPTGDLSTQGTILQTGILGDASKSAPDDSTTATPSPPVPTLPGTFTATASNGAGALTNSGQYRYRIVYVDRDPATDPGPAGESKWVDYPPIAGAPLTLGATDDTVDLANLPGASAPYDHIRIYRTKDQSGSSPDTSYYLLDDMDVSGSGPFNYTDVTSDAAIGANDKLNTNTLSGTYDYYIVYSDATGGPPNGTESRPSERISSVTVSNGRILLDNLPSDTDWSTVRIYRNTQANRDEFHFVAEIPTMQAGEVFTDSYTDAQITANPLLDADGPRAQEGTLLTDVLQRDGTTYSTPFVEGATITFTPKKGGRGLDPKTFTVEATTTLGDFLNFMKQAMGLQVSATGTPNPIPPSDDGSTQTYAGVKMNSNGQIVVVGNNGEGNGLEISLASLQQTTASGTNNLNVGFSQTQAAVGESAAADFIVYDSLGIPLSVRVSAVLESRTSAMTTYRWFADSGSNDPTTGVNIAVGTGLISFDGAGNILDTTNTTVTIDRQHVSSESPLSFELDFSKLSGLSVATSALAASRQDGSAAGVLSSFLIGEDGLIRGIFSNGITRDLGQLVLARFSNPNGLVQRGENMFAAGVNSGLPVQGSPGEQGIGKIVAGAIELSNTDVGKNLIDLILASSQYRSNSRVITTAQQLLDELLNIRR